MTLAPTHWNRGRIKWDTVMVAGATPSTDDDGFWLEGDDPSGTPFVAIGDMSRRERVSATAKSLSAEGLASRSMPLGRPGTLLFAMYASVGEVAFLDISATWNQALLGITPDPDKVDSRFLRYVLFDMRDDLLRDVRSNTQANLNAGQVGDIWFQRPPLKEQRAIADYLDREIARIDTLIEEQQRLIEMLRERRRVTIDTAINPTAEWPQVQLRRLTSVPIDAGVDEQGNPGNPDGWPRFIRTTDIASLTTLDPAKRVTVNPGAAATATLRRDDLVATRAGATIGKTYIHLSDEEACYAGYLVRIRPDVSKVSPIYLAYWTQSTHYLGQVASGAVKSTIENYSAAKYRATMVPVPPLDDQRRIVAYLDEQTAKIDTLTTETERFIELAKERRVALVTAAVTGQIDVREMV